MANKLRPTPQGCLFVLGFLGMARSPQDSSGTMDSTGPTHSQGTEAGSFRMASMQRHKHVINRACFENALKPIFLALSIFLILPSSLPFPSLPFPLHAIHCYAFLCWTIKWYFMRYRGVPWNLPGYGAARSKQNYFGLRLSCLVIADWNGSTQNVHGVAAREHPWSSQFVLAQMFTSKMFFRQLLTLTNGTFPSETESNLKYIRSEAC